MKTKALRSMNLDSTWVGTRSTRVPNFWAERWGRGGTRPYRIQEVNAQNLFRGILILTATLACAASIGLAAEISLKSAPPVVVKTVPVAGATDVDPGLPEIKVTYSKAMQDGSWSWSTWGEENYPETTGKPKYLQDGRTCVQPVKLQPNKFYAIWLNSEKFKNFKDVSGRPAVPYLLTFYTGEAANDRPATGGTTIGKRAGTTVGMSAERATAPTRKFVRLVVGKDEMTFEGKPTTREQLEDRLAEVPNRAQTVLELAVTADGPPAMKFVEMQELAGILVRRLGFEYLSLVGVHTLGSKGELAERTPPNRKFVKIVVGKDAMTFEGAPVTRDQLETRLAEVTDRAHTVLELAGTTDGSTADGPSTKDLFEMEARAGQLARKLGFEYLSLVGVHPLGSKGGQPPQSRQNQRPADEVIAQAIGTISQCAEGDPRVGQALTQLHSLPDSQAVAGLVSYLESSKDTVRRSAVYVLQKGGFADIAPAVAPLQKLLAHEEDLTRGMAALALGQNHVRESFEAVVKMTRDDKSGYARRCAAYALGLLGDQRAKPVLTTALNDAEAMVRNNARAALEMLNTSKPSL